MEIYVIAGPTAIGKTAAAIALAHLVGGEIISADSMQVYRGMDIATAKPSHDEMEGITHHLLDVVYPDEHFSVALYQKMATKAIDEIRSRGKIPIVVGGTGFYINALIFGAEFSENSFNKEEQLRDSYIELAKEKGAELIYEQLLLADPVYASIQHPNNIKRIARALAYCKSTGKLFSEHNLSQKNKQHLYETRFVVLTMQRDTLYNRINTRTEKMFGAGLMEETVALLAKGYNEGLASMNGIGYKEMVRFLSGEISKDKAISNTQQATRNYAKRQITWFKNQNPTACFIEADGKIPEELAKKITNPNKPTH